MMAAREPDETSAQQGAQADPESKSSGESFAEGVFGQAHEHDKGEHGQGVFEQGHDRPADEHGQGVFEQGHAEPTEEHGEGVYEQGRPKSED